MLQNDFLKILNLNDKDLISSYLKDASLGPMQRIQLLQKYRQLNEREETYYEPVTYTLNFDNELVVNSLEGTKHTDSTKIEVTATHSDPKKALAAAEKDFATKKAKTIKDLERLKNATNIKESEKEGEGKQYKPDNKGTATTVSITVILTYEWTDDYTNKVSSDTSDTTVVTAGKANSRKGPWANGVNAHNVTIMGKDYLIPDGLDGAIDNPNHRMLPEFIELDHKGRELVTKAYKAKQKEDSLTERQDQEEEVKESVEPAKEDGPKVDVKRDDVDEWINVRTEKYKEVHKLDASQDDPANKHYINFKQDYVVLIRKKPFFAATAQQRYVDATETMVTPLTQSDTGTETVTTPVTFDNYYWKYDLEPAWEYHQDSDTSMGAKTVMDEADVDSRTSSQTLTFDSYFWNHKLEPPFPPEETYTYKAPEMLETNISYTMLSLSVDLPTIYDSNLCTDVQLTAADISKQHTATFQFASQKELDKAKKEYEKKQKECETYWEKLVKTAAKNGIKSRNLQMVKSENGKWVKWDWEKDIKKRLESVASIEKNEDGTPKTSFAVINESEDYFKLVNTELKRLGINEKVEFKNGKIWREKEETKKDESTDSDTTYEITTEVTVKTANYDLMQSSNVNTARHDIEQYLNPLIKTANDYYNLDSSTSIVGINGNNKKTILDFYTGAKKSLEEAKTVLFDNLKEGMIVSVVYNKGEVYIKPGIANDANINYKIIAKERDPSPLKTVYDYSSDTSTLSTDLNTFNSEVTSIISLTDKGVTSVNETVQDYFKKARASVDSLKSTFGGQFADKVKFTIDYKSGKGEITGKKPGGTNTAQSPYMYSKDYKVISQTNDGTNLTTVATFKDVLRDKQGRPILPEDNYLRAYQVNNFINISVNTSVHQPGTCSVTVKGAERVICAENNRQSSNGWFSWSDLVGGWLNIDEDATVNDGTGSEYTTTSALDREKVQRQEKGKEGAITRSSGRYDAYNPGTDLSKSKNVSWRKAQSNWSQVQNGPFSADTTFRTLFKAREAKYGWRFAEKCDWEPMDEILIFGKSLTLRADDKELDSEERDENGILEGYHHNTSAMFKMEQIFFGYIEQVNKTYDASRGCVISVTAKDHMKLLEQTRTCTTIGNMTPGMTNGIPALDWSDVEYGLVRIIDPIMIRAQLSDGTLAPAGTVPGTQKGAYASIAEKAQQFPYFFGNCFAGWYPDEIIQTLSVQSGVPEKFVTKRVEPMHQFCPYLMDSNHKPLDIFNGNSETAYSVCQKAAQRLMLEFFADEEGNIVLKIPNWALGANMLQMNNCNIKYPDDIKNAKLPQFEVSMTKDNVPILHVKGDSGGAGGSSKAAGGGLAASVSNFTSMINDAMSKLLKSTDGKKSSLETLPANLNPDKIGATWANPNVCTNKPLHGDDKGANVKSSALIDLESSLNVLASMTDNVIEDILDKQLTNVTQLNEHTIQVKVGQWYQSHIGSLYNLAKRYYGNGRKWQLIADANNIKDPSELVPGQTIKIIFDEPISDYLVGGCEIIDADDFVVHSNVTLEELTDQYKQKIKDGLISQEEINTIYDNAIKKFTNENQIKASINTTINTITNVRERVASIASTPANQIDWKNTNIGEGGNGIIVFNDKNKPSINVKNGKPEPAASSVPTEPKQPSTPPITNDKPEETPVQTPESEQDKGDNKNNDDNEVNPNDNKNPKQGGEPTETGEGDGKKTENENPPAPPKEKLDNNSGVSYDLPYGWTPNMLKPGFKDTPEYKALSHKDRQKVCKAYNKKMKEEGKSKQDQKLEAQNAQKDAALQSANTTIENLKRQLNSRMAAACKFLSGRTDMDIPVLKSEYIISFTLMDSDQDVYNYISVQGTNMFRFNEGTPQNSRCIPLWDNICQFGLRAHPAMEANVLCSDPTTCELMGAMLLFKSQANRYKAVVTAIDDSAIRVGNPIRMYMYDEHPFRNATYIYFSQVDDEVQQNDENQPNVNFDGSGTTTETLNLSFDNYCIYNELDPKYPSAVSSGATTTDTDNNTENKTNEDKAADEQKKKEQIIELEGEDGNGGDIAKAKEELAKATKTYTTAFNAALKNKEITADNLDNSEQINVLQKELDQLEEEYNKAINSNKAAKNDPSSSQLKQLEKSIKQYEAIIKQQEPLIKDNFDEPEKINDSWEQIVKKYGLDKNKIQSMGTTENGWKQAAITEAKKKQQNAKIAYTNAKTQLNASFEKKQTLEAQIAKAKADKEASQKDIDDLKKRINEKKKRIKDLQKDENKANKQAEKAEKNDPDLKAKRLAKEAAEKKLKELQDKLDALKNNKPKDNTVNDKNMQFKIVKTAKAWDKIEQGEFPDSDSTVSTTKSLFGAAKDAWDMASDVIKVASSILESTQNKTVKKYYEKAKSSAESIKTAWESAYKPGSKFTIDFKGEKIKGTRTLHEGSGVDEAQNAGKDPEKKNEEKQEAVIFDERIFREQAVFYVESMSRNIDVQNVSTMTLQLRAGRMMGQASCFDIMAYFYNLYYQPWQSRQFYYDRGGNNTGLIDPHFQDGKYEQALHAQYNINRDIRDETAEERQKRLAEEQRQWNIDYENSQNSSATLMRAKSNYNSLINDLKKRVAAKTTQEEKLAEATKSLDSINDSIKQILLADSNDSLKTYATAQDLLKVVS